MVDTLMALWNRGHGGRGFLVTIAFFLICISISLLFVTVEGVWTAWLSHTHSTSHPQSMVNGASLTATAQANNVQPVADDTVTIYAPTPTPTPSLCTTSVPVAKATRPRQETVTVPSGHGGGSTSRPTPTPTRPRPIPTVIKSTPTPGVTPTPSPTSTPTPGSTPTPTPTPSSTATATPPPSPTPTPTPGVTPTPSPTILMPISGVKQTPSSSSKLPSRGQARSTKPTRTPPAQQTGNTGSQNCRQTHIGDNLDLNTDPSIMATLEANLGFILLGSMLGTILFYGIVYFLVRKKMG